MQFFGNAAVILGVLITGQQGQEIEVHHIRLDRRSGQEDLTGGLIGQGLELLVEGVLGDEIVIVFGVIL